tara:strand:- start:461 stop:634 length:174 start_codon:yes stop_codon:yes gene_type:complete
LESEVFTRFVLQVVVEEDIHNLVEAEASRKAEVVRTAQDHHIVEEDIQTLLRWMLLN